MTRDSRGVPPTPPSGLPRVDLPAMDPAGGDGQDDASVANRQRRPEAPAWSFGPTSEPQAVAKKPMGACPVCGSDNPINYRFCALCGGKLQAGPPSGQAATAGPPPVESGGPSSKRLPKPPPPSGRAPSSRPPPESRTPDEVATVALEAIDSVLPHPHQPLSDTKIVGAPVVDIAPNAPKPEPTHPCWRCSGINATGARFCKYCGAPLERGMVSERPPWTPPAEPASDIPPPVELRSSPPGAAPGPAIPRSPPAPHVGSGLGGQAPAPASQRVTVEALGPPSVAPATIPKPRPPAPTAPGNSPSPARAPEAGAPLHAPPRPAVAKPAPTTTSPAPGRRDASANLDAANGRLVVIVEDGSEGRSFALTGSQVDIGRTEGDILLYHDHYVSPRHARLVWSDDHWHLRDLGSVNRVYVRIRRPTPLRDGDLLLLGLEVLQFQTVSDAERGLGPATQHGTLLFGSPASPRRARLNQRTVEGVTRDVFHLFRDETVIGREVGDIVFTADPFLSRRHAAIRRGVGSGSAGDAFTLADLDSSNGTYLAIREDVPLEHGDFVRIGQHLFRLDFSPKNAGARGESPPQASGPLV